MATKEQFIRDCQAANDSKAYAMAFFTGTETYQQRQRMCMDVCRAHGIPGCEMAGILLEHLVWSARVSTSKFGTYDSAATIAAKLGWRSRDQVKRALAKLVAAGLIETGLGIPEGRMAPTNHYRITQRLGKLLRGLINALRRVAQPARRKSPNVVLPDLSAKTRERQKPFKSQATRNPVPVPAAHREFKPEPPRKRSAVAVGAAAIGLMRQLVRGGSTQ